MALKIRWTERALQELEEIIDYLESKWTNREISQFFKKLEVALESISKDPERNKVSQRRADTREYQINRQVTLFYTFNQEFATIMLVWPNRKNPAQI